MEKAVEKAMGDRDLRVARAVEYDASPLRSSRFAAAIRGARWQR